MYQGLPDLSWWQTLFPFSHGAPSSACGSPGSLRCLSMFPVSSRGKLLGYSRFVWIFCLHAALKVAYHEGYNLALFRSPCCRLQTLLIFLTFLLFHWLCVRATWGLPCALPKRLVLLISLLWNDIIVFQILENRTWPCDMIPANAFPKDCKTWLQNA